MNPQGDGLEPLVEAWEPRLWQRDEAPVEAAVPGVVAPGAVVARLAAAVAPVPLGREEAGQRVPAVVAAWALLVARQRVLSS